MTIVSEPTRSNVAKAVREPRRTPTGDPYIFRCYVRKIGSQFIGECVDLDILAYGDSMESAKHSLNDAVVGYLKVVFEGSTAGLIPRPSPLRSRLRYRWFCFLAMVSAQHRTFRLFDLDSCLRLSPRRKS